MVAWTDGVMVAPIDFRSAMTNAAADGTDDKTAEEEVSWRGFLCG